MGESGGELIIRNMIELKNAKVRLKDRWTWGDQQKVQAVMLGAAKSGNVANNEWKIDGSAMIEANYTAMELAIMEIEENGEKKQFSREWIDNLSPNDGEKVMNAVNELQKKSQ